MCQISAQFDTEKWPKTLLKNKSDPTDLIRTQKVSYNKTLTESATV